MSTTAPALDPDLVAGLKRLKLAKVRAIAPEVLQAAKTQRWKPEEVLRTLVDAEIAARDESNARARLRAAGFPVTKSIEEFNLSLSSVPRATFDYLASLEWIRAQENLCFVGPAGTGKSHLLIALGHAAVAEGLRVRYFAAADLVETLYRGLADNSVAKVIDSLLRNDLVILDELGFAPLDLAGSQLLFRFVAAAYERRSLGIASHWPFEAWGRFLPEHSTATSLLDGFSTTRSWWSPRGRATGCARPRRREVAARQRLHRRARGGDFRWPQVGTSRWPLTDDVLGVRNTVVIPPVSLSRDTGRMTGLERTLLREVAFIAAPRTMRAVWRWKRSVTAALLFAMSVSDITFGTTVVATFVIEPMLATALMVGRGASYVYRDLISALFEAVGLGPPPAPPG